MICFRVAGFSSEMFELQERGQAQKEVLMFDKVSEISFFSSKFICGCLDIVGIYVWMVYFILN